MKLIIGKTQIACALSALILFATVFAHTAQSDLQTSLRNLFFDTYQTAKPRSHNDNKDSIVVIIDIDETSLAKIGQWPWPRTKLATIIETLTDAGALAIGFDMVFSEPDRTDPKELAKIAELKSETKFHEIISKLPRNDDVFKKAIANSPTVLGFIGVQEKTSINAIKIAGISWLGDDLSHKLQSIKGTIASLESLQEGAKGSANFNIAQDQVDDIIRSVPLFVRKGKQVYPSLSIETLRVALEKITGEQHSFIIKTSLASGEVSGLISSDDEELISASIIEARVGDFIFPTTDDGQLNLYYKKHNENAYISAADILLAPKEDIANKINGKIVLIGASAAGLRDIRQTTLGERIPGVEIHSQIIDQIMDGVFLNRPDWMNGLEILLTIIAGLLLIFLMPYFGPVPSALLGVSISAMALITSWVAFSSYGLLLDPVFPILATALIYIAMTVFLFTFADREKRFVRDAFKHYLAPELIDRLQKDPKSLKLGGELKELSMMFMDIRGFTPISEKLPPTQLVEFLNTLLSPLSDIIQTREGTIDKYIGDSIMAFWNAPLVVEDHPQKACLAALEMVSKLERMNAENAFGFKAKKLSDVTIGIGINTGEGCVGNLGSKSRFDYSVIGDMVNVASRIESTTKLANYPILISSSTADACPNFAILWAGNLPLKGKREKQNIYALIGNEEYAKSRMFKEIKAAHDEICKQIGMGNKQNIELSKRRCINLAPANMKAFISSL